MARKNAKKSMAAKPASTTSKRKSANSRRPASQKRSSSKSTTKAKPDVKVAVKVEAKVKSRRNSAVATSLAPACYVLPANCDTAAASNLKVDLLSYRGRDIEVDASQVQRLGVLSAQVLVSAIRTWFADGKKLSVMRPAKELASSLALLGLANSIGQEAVVMQ